MSTGSEIQKTRPVLHFYQSLHPPALSTPILYDDYSVFEACSGGCPVSRAAAFSLEASQPTSKLDTGCSILDRKILSGTNLYFRHGLKSKTESGLVFDSDCHSVSGSWGRVSVQV